MHHSAWDERWLRQTLSLSTGRTGNVTAQLVAEKYIEPSPDHKGTWRNTSKGNALACASAAPPLLRQSAQRKLDELLNRVRFVNSPECEFLYWVGEVVLFGRMLTQKARISDVDLSVRLDRKYKRGDLLEGGGAPSRDSATERTIISKLLRKDLLARIGGAALSQKSFPIDKHG